MNTIRYSDYLDKVHGGWLGKCLGGAAGAPVEGLKKIIDIAHYSEVFRQDLPNDDLDLQLLWLEVLQKKGFAITGDDLAMAWQKQCWYPFSEYGYFLKNYKRGIAPPYSGTFNNPFFKDGEGCPIRSEIWGMCFPGNAYLAAEYAKMDGELDHSGTSVWIEQYLSAIEAQAFFQPDIQRLLKDSLYLLPQGNKTRYCVEEMFKEYAHNSTSWECARTKLMRRFGHPDFTNSVVNLGIVVIALLYGKNDLDTTINIAFRCGYDTDCTCATAGSLLGIAMGAAAIDPALKKMVDDQFVVGIDLERTNNSIIQLSKETCALGVEAQLMSGCTITDIPPDVTIPVRQPSAALSISVEYAGAPAIGYQDSCAICIAVTNNSSQPVSDTLTIEGLPAGWTIDCDCVHLCVQAKHTVVLKNCVHTPEAVIEIANTNLMTVRFSGYERIFGIAGASIWTAVGPFFEALDKPDPEGIPSPHGEGCILPTLECMVNNYVDLEKPYLDEHHLQKAMADEDSVVINAYEDLLPLDREFTFEGQGCIYLSQTVLSPDAREVWFIIGNNDGFKLWVNGQEIIKKDEIRLWTPYNNYCLAKLSKGENHIAIKLLRRTESAKFSFGIRKYEGEHFHRKQWYTDFISKLL